MSSFESSVPGGRPSQLFANEQRASFMPKMSQSYLQISGSINDDALRYMKTVSSSMRLAERYCALIVDGIEIETNFSLIETYNSLYVESFAEIAQGDQLVDDHVLVFTICGIAKRWKQPLGFYFTHKAANEYILKELIKQVVKEIHENTDFRIVASVCDGCSWNVAAIRKLSEECGKQGHPFVYNIDDHQIIHLFNVPYMLKSMRDSLMIKNIIFDGKVAKWSDIEKLNEFDKDSENGFEMTRLTDEHINPTDSQKKELKFAAQVFSSSVGRLLHFTAKTNIMDCVGTAMLTMFMDNLFDSLNCVLTSKKPLASKVTRTSHHHKFWDGAKKKLQRIKFVSDNNCEEDPPLVRLLLATVVNAQYLWEYLKGKGFRHLTLRPFNQDPLKKFLIAKGLCSGTKLSASQFGDFYKSVILNNCEDDDDENEFLNRILLLNRPDLF